MKANNKESINIDGIDYHKDDRIKLFINLNQIPPEMTEEETIEYEKRKEYVKMFKYNDKDDTVYTCNIKFSNEMAARLNDDSICVFDYRYHGKYLTPSFGVDDIAHLLCQCIDSRVVTHMERIHILREFYDTAMECMSEGMDFEMEDKDIQTRL